MNDSTEVAGVSLASIFSIEVVKAFFTQTNVTFAVQTTIGILTVLYLSIKIYKLIKNEKSSNTENP
jgi:hypothetical protein